jgi:cytochrome c
MKALAIAVAAMGVSMGAALAQDAAAGEASFKKWCQVCHAVGEGAKNKLGPVLNGLSGRKSGSIPEYKYSDANKNSGLTWDQATFLDYIKDPKAKIPGTKMVLSGIKNEEEAKSLWVFLDQHGPDGKKK